MVASNSFHKDQGPLGEFALGEFVQEPEFTAAICLPWSEPVRYHSPSLSRAFAPAWFGNYDQPVPRLDSWFEPFPDPIRVKKWLPAHEHPHLFYTEAGTQNAPRNSFAEQTTYDRYGYPWRDPVRAKPGLGAHLQQFTTLNPFGMTLKETVTESRWHQPWSEPTRRRGLPAAEQPWLAYVAPSAPTEIITPDKWLYPYSTPAWQKPGLGPHLQQALAFVEAAPFPEGVSVDRWLLGLSEPVRQKRGVPAYEQQTLAFVKADPFPETVSIDRWLQPFSTPVIGKRVTPNPATTMGTPPIVSFGWANALSEPTRRRLIIESAATLVPVAAEIVTPDKWYAPLSTPPIRVLFRAGDHQFLAYIGASPFPEIVSVDRWLQPLSDPARRKYTAEYPAFALSPIFFVQNVVPSMATWNEWWGNPVRLQPGLLAAMQQGTTMPVIPQPNPPSPTGFYTVSGLYVTDQFTDNTVVYDYGGGVSKRTN